MIVIRRVDCTTCRSYQSKSRPVFGYNPANWQVRGLARVQKIVCVCLKSEILAKIELFCGWGKGQFQLHKFRLSLHFCYSKTLKIFDLKFQQ